MHIQEEGGGGVGTYFKGNLNVENLFSKKQDNLIVTVMFAITGDLPPLQIIMKIEYFYKVRVLATGLGTNLLQSFGTMSELYGMCN